MSIGRMCAEGSHFDCCMREVRASSRSRRAKRQRQKSCNGNPDSDTK